MKQKLIRATELAEFVYCSKAWHLKYLDGAEVSPGARKLQAAANAWHIEQVDRLLVLTAIDGQYRRPDAGDCSHCLLLAGVGEMVVLLMAATAMVLAILFFWLSANSRKRTGIPAGEVFYQDLVGQPFAAQDLRSLKLGISGKPDCLIRTADGIVPVELKNSKRPPDRGEVYPNHMIQNLAYCALVEEQLRGRVPYGLVIYARQQVRRVEFTDSTRKWLTHTIAAVQAARLKKQANRNHNHRGRCSGCGVRDKCDQALR